MSSDNKYGVPKEMEAHSNGQTFHLPVVPTSRKAFSLNSTGVNEIESGDPVRSHDHGVCDYDGDSPDDRFSEATRHVVDTLRL